MSDTLELGSNITSAVNGTYFDDQDDDMSTAVKDSNEYYDIDAEDIDAEAMSDAKALADIKDNNIVENLHNPLNEQNFEKEPAQNLNALSNNVEIPLAKQKPGIIFPNFQKKSKSIESIETRLKNLPSGPNKFPVIKPVQQKPSLNLSNLFQSPVIAPIDRAPINANSYEGKLAILARKERDAKARARDLCITNAGTIATHFENWPVIYNLYKIKIVQNIFYFFSRKYLPLFLFSFINYRNSQQVRF